jgi:transcriptional regulator with XRE-family HTH domain
MAKAANSASLQRTRSNGGGMQLGERLRRLRVGSGLTQTELAGERFSREYVSQIERGKTRPTKDTVEWLAARLGVDAAFLETGVSTDALERTSGLVSRAEAAVESRRYEEATTILVAVPRADLAGAPELELRALLAEAWARMYLGETRKALDPAEQAHGVVRDLSREDFRRRAARITPDGRILRPAR